MRLPLFSRTAVSMRPAAALPLLVLLLSASAPTAGGARFVLLPFPSQHSTHALLSVGRELLQRQHSIAVLVPEADAAAARLQLLDQQSGDLSDRANVVNYSIPSVEDRSRQV